MTDIEKKTGMTDAEADYWVEYFTTHPIKAGPNLLKQGIRPGFTAPAKTMTFTITLDANLGQRLTSIAEESHETPSEVVAEMVRREMALAA
jgi:hypothetical protein